MKVTSGDLVYVDFNPIRGREQAGTRPAVVLTDATFHDVSRLALVCPVTSNAGPWPFKVLLPDGLNVAGAILVDQIRAIDRDERILRHVGNIPAETLQMVRHILVALVGWRG